MRPQLSTAPAPNASRDTTTTVWRNALHRLVRIASPYEARQWLGMTQIALGKSLGPALNKRQPFSRCYISHAECGDYEMTRGMKQSEWRAQTSHPSIRRRGRTGE